MYKSKYTNITILNGFKNPAINVKNITKTIVLNKGLKNAIIPRNVPQFKYTVYAVKT